MLLRHGFHYPKAAWYGAHERTLAQVTFPHPAQDIAYAEYRAAVHKADDRVIHITAALREQVATWRFAPVVNALTALKGMEFIAAATLVAELGDFSRLERPSELMGYLGLVPSEYTSGDSRTHGAIAETGNTHVVRILIESAWNYRYPAKMRHVLDVRNQGQPKVVREIAWKSQLRPCSRYRRQSARGMHHNKVCTAIARELAGCV